MRSLEDTAPTQSVNQCEGSSDCGGGRCVDGQCVAVAGEIEKVLLEVVPPMVAGNQADGGSISSVRYLVEREIPVCGHLGLTPQSVHRFGGFKVQGREDAAAAKLREDALAVAEAGAALLVLEGVPASLATQITAASPIPTIGIGAGAGCDGQVLVLHDLLGLDTGHRKPKFVKDFLAEGGSVAGAIRAYAEAVRDGSFPDAEHAYA